MSAMIVPRGLELQIAVAKVGKYASGDSGDTVEVIERPQGGLSIVLADGQRSGRAAKLISTIATRKIVSLLADGVRDGAAARAAHDYLRTLREGKVSAEVTILSVDLSTGTIVLSRNTRCPSIIARIADGQRALTVVDEPGEPIGIYPRTKPVITEMPLEAGTYVVSVSDGALHAGSRQGRRFDLVGFIHEWLINHYTEGPHVLADALLSQAVALDEGRPDDDISVIVLSVQHATDADPARRMYIRFPI